MSSTDLLRKQRRRRILKSAVGVPAVLTIPSGMALAAGSVLCTNNEGNVLSEDFVREFLNPEAEESLIESLALGPGKQGRGKRKGPSGSTGAEDDPLFASNSTEEDAELPAEVEIDGQLYINDGEGNFVAASCWASINPDGVRAALSSRIA